MGKMFLSAFIKGNYMPSFNMMLNNVKLKFLFNFLK